MKLLFVSWDGPQVTYLESLFLPIFAGLRARGIQVDVLQFRWGDEPLTERTRSACAHAGIGYRAVKVARILGPAGPFLTALFGGRHVRRAMRDFRSDLIMPRSVMPAIAVMAAGGAGLKPLVFDADGLAADERADLPGGSRKSLSYRLLRWVETRMTRRAAIVLVRTAAAADILATRAGVSRDRFKVVTNGRDEQIYHPRDPAARAQIRDSLGIPVDAPLVLYLGSVGPKYRLDLVRQFADALARQAPTARLLVLTGSPELAAQAIGASPPLSPVVLQLPPEAVPDCVAAADLGLAFFRQTFSMQATAPIKLAEYLMCGVPVVGTSAVGQTQSAVDAGVFLDEGAGMDAAVTWLLTDIMPNRERYRTRARAEAMKTFGLRRSIEDYAGALQGVFPR